jgi:hypothetical protein
MYKINLDINDDYTSNAFTTVAELLANAGLESHDVHSITRNGRLQNGCDDFEIVFFNRRAAEYAVAWYYDEEDIEIEFVREQVELV